ncbi:MAG: hypothetical protein FD135_1018 [Comamonadaceae bacterium]|nr:MAG: hypothetical protein FD135_1018 [Comamonadaceae bacterium]
MGRVLVNVKLNRAHQHILHQLHVLLFRCTQPRLLGHTLLRKLRFIKPRVPELQLGVAMDLFFHRFQNDHDIRHLAKLPAHRRTNPLRKPKVGIRVQQDFCGHRVSSACNANASCMGMSITC